MKLSGTARACLVVAAASIIGIVVLTHTARSDDARITAAQSWLSDWTLASDAHRAVQALRDRSDDWYDVPQHPTAGRPDGPRLATPVGPVAPPLEQPRADIPDKESLDRLERSAIEVFDARHPGWTMSLDRGELYVVPDVPSRRMDSGAVSSLVVLLGLVAAGALLVAGRRALLARKPAD